MPGFDVLKQITHMLVSPAEYSYCSDDDKHWPYIAVLIYTVTQRKIWKPNFSSVFLSCCR